MLKFEPGKTYLTRSKIPYIYIGRLTNGMTLFESPEGGAVTRTASGSFGTSDPSQFDIVSEAPVVKKVFFYFMSCGGLSQPSWEKTRHDTHCIDIDLNQAKPIEE